MNNEEGKIWYGLGIDNTGLQVDARKSSAIFRGIGDQAASDLSRVDKGFNSLGVTIAGALGGASIVSFGRSLIEITGQFQTFEAVLTNTLNSPAKARSSMMMIQEFAATTPFQVDALTGSFVSLANQGFVPTMSQMIKLGDLASSTGKGFDQLSEAIIDAQVGEMERLKEFGIRASKEGDKVTFTFKEQATQVDNTASSIREYILSLGELQGVQGSNAAISATLTGQMSNLQDLITQKMNGLGQSSSGVLSGAISGTALLVENYEQIGRVLGVLIGTYGVYKAALIAVAAYQKAMVLVQTIQQFNQMTSALRKTTQAQILLNQAVGANPYIKLASILMTVGGLIWAFARDTNEAAKAVKSINEKITEEKKELDSLYTKLKDAKDGTTERTTAINDFNNSYGKYLGNLLSEKSSVEDIATAYENAKDKIVEYSIEKARVDYLGDTQTKLQERESSFIDEISDWSKELDNDEQRGRFQAYVNQIVEGVKNGDSASAESLYEAFRAAQAEKAYPSVEKWLEAFRAGEEEFGKGSLEIIDIVGGWDVSGAELELEQIKMYAEILKKRNEEFDAFSKGFTDTLSKDSGSNPPESELPNYSTTYKLAEKEWKDAKIAYDKIIKDKTATVEAFNDAKSKLENTEKAFHNLGGKTKAKTPNKHKDHTAKIDQEENGVERRTKELGYAITQAEIDVMKEGSARIIKQNNLNYQKKKDQIEQQEAELLAMIQELERTKWEAKNPDWKDHGLKFEPDTKVLPTDIASQFNTVKIGIETQRNISNESAKKVELDSLLKKYQTYTDKRKSIEDKFNADITKLKATNVDGSNDGKIVEAERLRNEILTDLDTEIASRETDFDAWADSMLNAGLVKLKEALETARDTLDADGGKLSDADKAKLRAQIAALEDKIKVQEDNNTQDTSADKSKKKWTDTLSVMNDVNSSVENIISSFDGMDDATKATLSAATNIAGGTIAMIIGIQTLATAAAGTIKMVEKASIILAVIGAAATIITSLFNNAAEKKHQETLAEITQSKVDFQRQYNQLLIEQKLLMKDAESAFGTDHITKAIGSIEAYRMANKSFKDEMKGDPPEMNFWENMTDDVFGTYQKRLDDYKKGIGGLSNITVKTDSYTTGAWFWKKQHDVYTGILAVYPELIDAEGELVVAKAEAILATQQMSDEDRKRLESLVENHGLMEQAAEDLRGYISDTFGSLGDGIMDSIIYAIENEGVDAWEKFGEAGADVLENLGKQIAYTLFFSKKFEQLEKDLEKVYGSGKSEEEIAKDAMNVVGDFYNGIGADMDNAQDFMEGWQEAAKEHGLDLWGDEGRESSSKGIATASQDSVDENNGHLTAIQGHTYNISEKITEIAGYMAGFGNMSSSVSNQTVEGDKTDPDYVSILVKSNENILDCLYDIKGDTTHLVQMQRDMSALKDGIDNINLKGITIKK